MLVLTRKVGETLRIGEEIFVRVLCLQSGRVRLGISAPKEMPIRRIRQEARDPSTPNQPVFPVEFQDSVSTTPKILEKS